MTQTLLQFLVTHDVQFQCVETRANRHRCRLRGPMIAPTGLRLGMTIYYDGPPPTIDVVVRTILRNRLTDARTARKLSAILGDSLYAELLTIAIDNAAHS